MICVHNSVCTDSRRALDAKGYDRLRFVEEDMTVAGKVSSFYKCMGFSYFKISTNSRTKYREILI